jgi:YHS domain-containing protein
MTRQEGIPMKTETCPVCGAEVDLNDTEHIYRHGDGVIHFCGSDCAERFHSDSREEKDKAKALKSTPSAGGDQSRV